jgi:hypothetical protein
MKMSEAENLNVKRLERILQSATKLYLSKVFNTTSGTYDVDGLSQPVNISEQLTEGDYAELLEWTMNALSEQLILERGNVVSTSTIGYIIEEFFREHKIMCLDDVYQSEKVEEDAVELIGNIQRYMEMHNYKWRFWRNDISLD